MRRNGEIRRENEERNKFWIVKLQGDGRHTLWRVDRHPSTQPSRHQHHRSSAPVTCRPSHPMTPVTGSGESVSPTIWSARSEHVEEHSWPINRSKEERKRVGKVLESIRLRETVFFVICIVFFSLHFGFKPVTKYIVTLQFQFNPIIITFPFKLLSPCCLLFCCCGYLCCLLRVLFVSSFSSTFVQIVCSSGVKFNWSVHLVAGSVYLFLNNYHCSFVFLFRLKCTTWTVA